MEKVSLMSFARAHAMQNFGKYFIFPIALLLGMALLPLLAKDSASYSTGMGILFWSLIIYLSLAGMMIRGAAMRRYMSHIATALGLSYSPTEDIQTFTSHFNRGHDRESLRHILSGASRGLPVRIFGYYWSDGNGKNRRNGSYSICEITFPYHLPSAQIIRRIFLHSQFDTRGHRPITIRSDLDERFSVYALDDFESELFELFTPERIEPFIAQFPMSHVEFVGEKIYIIAFNELYSQEGIQKLMEQAGFLISTFSPTLERLADDVRAHHEVAQNK